MQSMKRGEVGAVGDETEALQDGGSGEEPSVDVGADGEQEEEGTDESTEKREVVKMADPREPTEEERREHNLTHLPFRSWCPHCVRGRGREADHRKYKEQAEGLHELHVDFMQMGKENQPRQTLTILVVKERRTKMLMATVVPSKSTGRFVAERVNAFIKELGIEHLDVVAKSDQEPAIKKVVEAVGRHRGEGAGRWITEFSPVGKSASNGVVERGIQSVQGHVRVLLDALEVRWKRTIATDECILPWIVEWAARSLNRLEIGKDGRTSYERCKGKEAKHPGIEIGEAVLWRKKPVGGALGKLSVAWSYGVFLGIKGRSNEFIVSDASGIYKTRTVQRRSIGDRWDVASAEQIRYVPWKVREDERRQMERF